MSIDPIALSKTGSIEQSTYASTASTAPSAKLSATPAASSGSTTETSNTTSTTDTAGKPTVSSSAFIVDKSLAALLDNGSQGLSGAQLATYNAQAMFTQNTGSLVANLSSGGDSFTSEIVGSSGSLSLYRTMQSAAANTGSSTGEAEGPVETALSSGTAEETKEAATGSGAVFADILATSRAVYGTGSTVKATTSAPETTTTAATTPAATASEKPTGSSAVFEDILKTSQALYGSDS